MPPWWPSFLIPVPQSRLDYPNLVSQKCVDRSNSLKFFHLSLSLQFLDISTGCNYSGLVPQLPFMLAINFCIFWSQLLDFSFLHHNNCVCILCNAMVLSYHLHNRNRSDFSIASDCLIGMWWSMISFEDDATQNAKKSHKLNAYDDGNSDLRSECLTMVNICRTTLPKFWRSGTTSMTKYGQRYFFSHTLVHPKVLVEDFTNHLCQRGTENRLTGTWSNYLSSSNVHL